MQKPRQTPRPKVVRRPVHGVLLLDKPLGLSSNDALQQAKRLYRAEKAGHTGTLDPLATGLLPLCFGAATKFSQIGLDADKRYRATLKLGVTTTTGDAEGEVLLRRPLIGGPAELAAACARFLGPILQVPPMHSALKRDGRALYEYARAGIEVEREARAVTVHRIDVVGCSGDQAVIDVVCSKGTYIRTLAEDIGEALGCGAHLAGLRRTGSGPLSLEGAVTLERLAAMSEAERDAALAPADALVADRPVVRLGAEDAGRFLGGLRRRVALPDMAAVRVYGPEPAALLGGAEVRGGELIATRLLSPAEVQGLLDAGRQAAEATLLAEDGPATAATVAAAAAVKETAATATRDFSEREPSHEPPASRSQQAQHEQYEPLPAARQAQQRASI